MIGKHRIASLVTTLLAALLLAPSAFAQTSAHCVAPETGGAMSERTYSAVSRAIELLGEDRNAEAEEKLLSVADKVEEYERAIVFQTLGFAQIQQDKMSQALQSFETALQTSALPRQANEDLLLNTGQIYLSLRETAKAIDKLLQYVELTCKPVSAEVWLALASAHAEIENYAAALTYVDKALALDVPIQESWLQLKLALHYELSDLVASAQTLIRLVVLVPGKEEHWRQLAGVLMQIEREEDALAVLAVAEQQGFITNEKDLKNLANLYLMLEIPYKAASLLEQGMQEGLVEDSAENFEYVSAAWISAYEWQQAETALEQAALRSDDGELWVKLAQVRIENEDWGAARSALNQALEKGVLDAGKAQYLLGIAAYNSQDTSSAIAALQLAVKHDAWRKEAQQWLDHLRKEQLN